MEALGDSRTILLLKMLSEIGVVDCICRTTKTSDNNSTVIFNNSKVYQFEYSGIKGYLSFIKKCQSLSKKKKYDVIFADNRAAIIPALISKRSQKSSLMIHDARELYDIHDVKHLRGKIGCLVEKKYMRKFDLVICANKYRAEFMRERFSLKDDPLVLENICLLEEDSKITNSEEEKLSSFFINDKWKILSTDGYSLIRRTDKLVSAMSELGDNYVLYIAGGQDDESAKERILKIIHDKSLDNVFYLGRLNRQELKYCIDKVDLGIVSYNQDDLNNQLCASGKLFEFINEGKPVVTTTNRPLKYYCDTYHIGLYDDDYYDAIKDVFSNYLYYKNQVEALDCKSLLKEQSSVIQSIILKYTKAVNNK